MRKLLVSLLAVAMLSGPGAIGPSAAVAQQTGLVNVEIGDVTIEDVNVALAAQIVAAICPGVTVGDVAVIARQVNREGDESEVICTVNGRDVTISQD